VDATFIVPREVIQASVAAGVWNEVLLLLLLVAARCVATFSE